MSHVCLLWTACQLHKCTKLFIFTELSPWNQTHIICYHVGWERQKPHVRGSWHVSYAAANFSGIVKQYHGVKIHSQQMHGTNKTVQSNKHTILTKTAYSWNCNEHNTITFMICKIQKLPTLLKYEDKLTYFSSVLQHLELFIYNP
jgi:hypothetical protein